MTKMDDMPRVGRNYDADRTPSTTLTIRIPKNWKPILEADAAITGISLSELIREAIREKHERIQREHSTLD